MEHAREIVQSALRRLGRTGGSVELLAAVWPLIVGKRLAERTRPVVWEDARIEVAVSGDAWRSELAEMAGDVCAQINRWWGGPVAREVRFVQARGKLPSRQSPKPSRRRSTPEQLSELEDVLAGISDPKLREVIARAAASYFSNQKDT